MALRARDRVLDCARAGVRATTIVRRTLVCFASILYDGFDLPPPTTMRLDCFLGVVPSLARNVGTGATV